MSVLVFLPVEDRVSIIPVEDRVRIYRQSPVSHANHEDAFTNVRSMRSAINEAMGFQYRTLEQACVRACVLHIKSLFRRINIQHTLCPCWFFFLWRTGYAYTVNHRSLMSIMKMR